MERFCGTRSKGAEPESPTNEFFELARFFDEINSFKQLLDVVKCSTGDNWFAQNYDILNWSKENFKKTNTMGILEKDLLSYLESKSENISNTHIDNYEKSVVEGIKNIPKVN